ncbi:DUF2177 family protein [Variovorax gossypii]|uniref:DUF2177 family protein n=1 Tax=Variovorax gossypii TaxID=1679495 RepID=A0A431TM41_9BURK|nr:DUF2177 family protein [Variovorax gossypii]RTQ34737.1 DUF2177 family protein [Variovorax gossypii]
MSAKHLVAWVVTLAVLLALDMVWLGVVAKDMYQQGMSGLMSPNPRLGFAAVFYLAYPIGLLVFAIVPGLRAGGTMQATLMGGLFGLFCYGTYDLTNLAVVRDWPVALSFIDMAWGTLVSGAAAAAGAAALHRFARH